MHSVSSVLIIYALRIVMNWHYILMATIFKLSFRLVDQPSLSSDISGHLDLGYELIEVVPGVLQVLNKVPKFVQFLIVQSALHSSSYTATVYTED